MVSVAELRRPELALHWHEAVAIVAEVAAKVMARGQSGIPAPESIILAPDGNLRFLDDGLPDATPGRWLGDMLGVVLSSVTCPPEVRQLVTDSVADPPAYATVQAFARALAFFERPDRHELLRTLAARLSEVEFQTRADAELERLQERARNQPDHADTHASPARWHVPRFVLIGTGAIVVGGMLAGGILALVASPSRVTIGERVRARVDEFTRQGLEALGVHTRTGPPPAPVAPAVEKRPRVVSKSAKRKPRALPLSISLAELTCDCHVSLPVLPGSASATASTASSHDVAAPDQTIYTADAEGVEPAVLLRPHLPSEPPPTVRPEEIGTLEIVVGPTGIVEHVRLISAANRFHERMIVAAAKAWVFEPATKVGHPVRFRTHIRITL